MKVLLALDSSDSSKAVLAGSIAHKWPAGTTVCVLSVVDVTLFSSMRVDAAPLIQAEYESVQSMVQFAADRFASQEITASTFVVSGYPPYKILEYSREWNADLIVVGSHGHNALTRFLIGSVAQSVLRNASCSVKIVRGSMEPPEGQVMKVLLATDGSETALAAARSVAKRRWAKNTQFKVLSVSEVALPAIEPWYGAAKIVESLSQERIEQAKAAVGSARGILASAGLESTEVIVSGYPKAAILDEAKEWSADLIVLGSHSRHGLNRLLLGSVSEAVAIHAACSVDVVRQPQLTAL